MVSSGSLGVNAIHACYMDQTRVAKKSYYDMCTYFHFPEQILSVNKLQKVCIPTYVPITIVKPLLRPIHT